jgi:hypothetical protein
MDELSNFCDHTRILRGGRYSGAAQLHDQGAEGGQGQAGDFLAGERFVQEEPGQEGDLDEHGVFDDAGFDGREGAQGAVPEGEGEGGVDQGQPADDGPVGEAEAG